MLCPPCPNIKSFIVPLALFITCLDVAISGSPSPTPIYKPWETACDMKEAMTHRFYLKTAVQIRLAPEPSLLFRSLSDLLGASKYLLLTLRVKRSPFIVLGQTDTMMGSPRAGSVLRFREAGRQQMSGKLAVLSGHLPQD